MGARVELLANADHSNLADRHGVTFLSISDPDWPQIGRDADAFFEQIVMQGFEATFRRISELVEHGARPLIVARTGHWGAQFTAERLGLQFMRVALQPCAIRQGGHPVSQREAAALDAWRRKIGLAPLLDKTVVPENTDHTLSLFPYEFGLPQSGWREAGDCVGFICLDDETFRPDEALAAFLERHGPPIVFSLGTGMQAIEVFFAAACQICDLLDRPVIFLSPNIQASDSETPSKMLVRESVDHSFLLPRSRVLVHNGGIGTIAQAIRANIRQIIIPLLFDQPDNTERAIKY